MSLTELTRNAYQNGIGARKWLALCKLFITKNHPHDPAQQVETAISNSVLVLFRDYPGDPTLQDYLKQALQGGILSLPILLTAFLLAAQSSDLRNAATLDMLCRVILDHHYASGMTVEGSLVPFGEPVNRLLHTVQCALSLVRVALELPISNFHQLTTSASELLALLLMCFPVHDVSQVPPGQAREFVNETKYLLGSMVLPPAVREALGTVVLSLTMFVEDDGKVARDTQVMHTLQSTVLGSSSETDVVTCSLVLNHLILSRAGDFGSGDTPRAVAILVALLRGSSWTPSTFYAQLIISALTCLMQSMGNGVTTRLSSIWRAFTIGRLPHLLAAFRKVGRPEGISDTEWNSAMQFALPHVMRQKDLLDRLDSNGQVGMSDAASEKSMVSHSFLSEFIYQLLSVGVVEQAVAATIHPNPNLSNDFHPRVATEAQEMGVDLLGYFEAKLSSDASPEDIEVLLFRAWRDPCCHAAFAEVVVKRFTTSWKNMDADSLGLVCKMLCQHEMALDMLSLHAKISDLVAYALAFIEDYDCEMVGDPQTAVTHLGDVVLFVDATITRFNLASHPFHVGDRRIHAEFLRTAGLNSRLDGIKAEEIAAAFTSWSKALFDPKSEGIEDTILRATRPKTLLKIAPQLFAHAIAQTLERKMDKEVFNNGISYFCGPLLNWTLAGVIRSLLLDIQRRGYHAPAHLEVLKTLLTTPSCPPAVLSLAAPSVLRLFPDPFPHSHRLPKGFDIGKLRQVARQALDAPAEEMQNHLSLNSGPPDWAGQCRELVMSALSAARAGRAPALDVDRCLLLCPPTKFLAMFWNQLYVLVTSTVSDVEAPRRLATFVLTIPRTSRAPPLLPIFLHLVLPSIVAAADNMPDAEQRICVDLLVAVISSSLTGALHLEWALHATCDEERNVLGQSVASMARRLAGDLKRRGNGTVAGMVLQRLTAMQPFVANFPTFASEV